MSTHTPTVPATSDQILAAIFDPTLTPADLPAKTGLSLPELARWFKANASLIAEVREFLIQRCTPVASRLHVSSLGALDRVVRECPDLERVRKAASTILRSLKPPTGSATSARTAAKADQAARANADPVTPLNVPHPDSESAPPHAATRVAKPPKLSIAERLAAQRLASMKHLASMKRLANKEHPPTAAAS